MRTDEERNLCATAKNLPDNPVVGLARLLTQWFPSPAHTEYSQQQLTCLRPAHNENVQIFIEVDGTAVKNPPCQDRVTNSE